MSETVLLVDDDPNVRAILSDVLGMGGFATLEAADGTTALKIAETTPRPIEILVTDINMPGIDGLELARRVQALRPAIGVVYMFGAPADVVAAGGLGTGAAFLPKPFDADVFLARVRDVMRRGQVGARAGAASPSRMPVGVADADGPFRWRPEPASPVTWWSASLPFWRSRHPRPRTSTDR